MFRHTVLFTFKPEITDEHKDEVVAALRALPAQIPELRSYHVGRNIGVPENYDLAIVAELDDAAAFERYLAHPAHEEVANTLLRPHVVARAAVQFEA